jgi:hypothetical protein
MSASLNELHSGWPEVPMTISHSCLHKDSYRVFSEVEHCRIQIPMAGTIVLPPRERRASMTAPRDSHCRYKECYNCTHRLTAGSNSGGSNLCALAVDGEIRVLECGGLRYYRPPTKAQRREQHDRLMACQVSG